jgi:hypothetical protein
MKMEIDDMASNIETVSKSKVPTWLTLLVLAIVRQPRLLACESCVIWYPQTYCMLYTETLHSASVCSQFLKFIQVVCLTVGAASKTLRLGSLYTTACIAHSSGGWEVQDRGTSRLVFGKGSLAASKMALCCCGLSWQKGQWSWSFV